LPEQPQPEPVAWRTFDGEGGYDYRTYEDNEDYAAEWAKRNPRHVGWVERLYTAPPQRKPLTEQEEPVAWMTPGQDDQDFYNAQMMLEELGKFALGVLVITAVVLTIGTLVGYFVGYFG
jgi:hypothetical protein